MAIAKTILAIDPGATRTGWAVLEPGPTHIASGVITHTRPSKQPFQAYRMELTQHWVGHAFDLLDQYKPDLLISEIVPSRGPEIMDQLYLANVQITVLHTIAMTYGVKVIQVSARSVQAKIAKRKGKSKISKPQVRDGVLEIFPELVDRLKVKGMKIWEESDACAIAAYFMIEEKM